MQFLANYRHTVWNKLLYEYFWSFWINRLLYDYKRFQLRQQSKKNGEKDVL